jgi:peptidoglycan/LPS O-acetylase OafA/YrhL
MIYHFWWVATTGGPALWQRVYQNVAGLGWAGVDLFFVLSGFLITGILYDSRMSPRYFRVFYGRRTVRIFPLYYAALAVFFVAIPFVLTHARVPVSATMRNSMHTGGMGNAFAWSYLVNWYVGWKGWDAIPHPIQHFWSLAIEEQFYLVWPLLVLQLTRHRLMQVCGFLVVLAFVLRGALYAVHLPVAAYTWTLCRTDSLAVGAMVALCLRDAEDWRKLLKWAQWLALPSLGVFLLVRFVSVHGTAGPGASPMWLMGTFSTGLGAIFFGACLALALSVSQEHAVRRMLGSGFLRFFGKYSYCLYVVHLPLIAFFAKAGFNTERLAPKLHHSQLLAVLVVNAVGFGISIAVAYASWHLYEKQWLKLKNLPALRRRTVIPEPPAA